MDERPDPNAPDQDEGIVAYHGSPHDFDQFNLSKIGTGEGAQAYGHGLYFAENEEVARGYRDSLSGKKQSVYSQGAPLDFNSWAAAAARNLDADAKIYGFDAAKKSQLDDLTFRLNRELKLGASGRPDEIQQAIALVQSATPDTLKVVSESSGHMYEVRINADPNKHFLDWDAPLSEQPEAIRRLAGWTPEWDEAHRAWRRQDTDNLLAELEGTGAYTPAKPPRPPAGALRASMRGEELYDHLHNKMGAADWPVDADAATRAEFRRAAAERVSQHLMDNGIRGIRYLDAGSRSSTDAPTRNYVVFDDKHVSVRRKYEQGGAVQAMATGGEVENPSFVPHGDPARNKALARFLEGNHPEVPHVVYHGTDRDIVSFDPEKAKSEGGAFFFARDSWTRPTEAGARAAGTYAPRRGGTIFPVHLSMKNPHIVGFTKPLPNENAPQAEWDKYFNEHEKFDAQFNDDSFKERYFRRAMDAAKANGNDGVIFKNITDDRIHSDLYSHPSDIFAVFSPSQIKSAIGNQGTFDPSDPDITKATGGEVGDETPYHQTPEFQNWFGGSVAHTDGVPMTYYHGTSKDKDYTSFNIGKHGLWLTADPAEASSYAEQNDSQGYTYDDGKYVKTNTAARVLPVHIKAENPYRGDKPEEMFQKQNYKKAQSDWFEQLRSQGYDSWIPDSQKGSLAVVLKAPTQIKSIYNRTFDPQNKRMDKAAGGEADQASDIPQIDNAVSVFPKPQRMFPEDAPVPGGMYLNAATKEDMTGHKAAMASIGVQPGGKPYFRASPDSVDETGTPGRGSAMAKTNLFKQRAGWKWAKAPEGHEATDTIVSVQHRGQHHYTLNAHFPKGVDLARYEKSPTEPRLRPTTQGNVTFGPQVGSILVRGKEHPVYEHVIVKSTGGEVSGKKAAGGSAVATLRRMSDPAVNEAIRVINRSGSSPRDAVTLSKRLLGRQ